MHTLQDHIRAVLAISVVALGGCSASSGPDNSGLDSTLPVDARSMDGGTSDVDASVTEADASGDLPPPSSLIRTDPDEIMECPPGNPSAWVEPYESPVVFELPEVEEPPLKGYDYDYLLGPRPSNTGRSVASFTARPPAVSIKGRAIFAEYGTDLHFQFLMKTGDVENDTIFITLMLDYEPLTVEFQRISPDRSEVTETVVASEHRFPVDSEGNGIMVDFIIPASELPEKRMYDVSIFAAATRVEDTYTYDTTHSRRVSLFYGSHDVPGHPCFDPGDFEPIESVNTRDFALWPPTFSGALVVPSFESWKDSRDGIDLPASETHLEAEVYIYNHQERGSENGKLRDSPSAFVPYINDVPWLDGMIWISQRGDESGFVHKIPVEIPIPMTPGPHRVVYHQWGNVFLPKSTPDGEWISRGNDSPNGFLPVEVRRPE